MLIAHCSCSHLCTRIPCEYAIYTFEHRNELYWSGCMRLLLLSQVMDDRWESEITEYGAINITGFRLVDTERRYVREFLESWKRLDPITSIGAGKESITVYGNYYWPTTIQIIINNHNWYAPIYVLNLIFRRNQAQAALMYDAVFVLVEAFNKLLRKKPDQFRSYTTRRSSSHLNYSNSSYGALMTSLSNNNNRILDCNTAKGWVNPWEHGDKISRYLRKVKWESIACFACVTFSRRKKKQRKISKCLVSTTFIIFSKSSECLPLCYKALCKLCRKTVPLNAACCLRIK